MEVLGLENHLLKRVTSSINYFQRPIIMNISEIKKHINELIETQKCYHVNDPRVYDLWNKMTDILTQDIETSIVYFQNCSEEELSWISQVFPDIMEKTNSKEFFNFLNLLISKHPTSDFKHMCEAAIEYFKE